MRAPFHSEQRDVGLSGSPMRSRARAWTSLILLASCQTLTPARLGPPAAILSGLSPMMEENGLKVTCLGDSTNIPDGTIPVDLLLAPDSGISSSVVRVVYTRTSARPEQPSLSVSVHEIGQTRVVGQGCGPRGVTLRGTAARFSTLALSLTTWVPVRITVRDAEWRALASLTLAATTLRPLELTWR